MWFDTHCHLYEIQEREPVDLVFHRARAVGVEGMLCVGVDPESSKQAIELAESSELVWAGAAFHPSASKGWHDEWADEIDALLAHPRVVAVGETGLDFYWDVSYIDDQRRMFAAHIDLAKKHDKPLVIHTRDSLDAALEMLEERGAPYRLVFHCWSGDREQLQRALSLGAHISFAGNVSFKNAPELREIAALVPAGRLLIETDSPYLAPVPKRGKPNEPAYVCHVGEAVATARACTPAEIAELTTGNARRLFFD